MKKIFLLFLISVSCCLSGCVYLLFPTNSLSLMVKPFSELEGKESRLKRTIKVFHGDCSIDPDEWKQDGVEASGMFYREVFDWKKREYVMKDHKIPDYLLNGTRIKFLDFRVNKNYYLLVLYKIRYTAKFKVIGNPEISEDLEFIYVWGRGLYLNRAPWEDKSVPESRYVGFN